MAKLGTEWFHVTIPIFLFNKAGACIDSNQAGKQIITQFESNEDWENWVKREILLSQKEELSSAVFYKTLPLRNSNQKYCVQWFDQKGEEDTYYRIQMIPMVEKTSTKKSKKIDWYQFIDSMKDLVYVIDYQRRFLFANEAFLGFLNKKTSEVIGNPIFSVFPQAKGTLIEENQIKVMDSGEAIHFQYFFPIPPYENWLDIQMIPMQQSVFVWIQTNTEEPTESLLKETFFQNIRKFWHFLPDPIILFDQSSSKIEANPAFYETFLLSSNQSIESEALWAWFFPEEKKNLQTAISRAFQENKVSTFEWKMPISRMIKKTFSVSVYPVLDATTTPVFAMVRCHDITEKIRQIQMASSQVESYSQIMNSLRFMLLVVSDEWKIQYANQTAKQFLDLQDIDFHQSHLLTVLPEIKEMELSEKIRSVLSEKHTVILEGIPLRNRLFYIALFSISSGVICLFRDVTEKNFLEKQASLTDQYTDYLIEHSPDAIYIQNKDGEVVFSNETYRQKEAVKQISGMIKTDNQVWEGNTVWNDLSPAFGVESLFLQLMQFPLKNDLGSVEGICGVIRDITETNIRSQLPVEYSIPWINLIQTIRTLISYPLSFRDWIKFFLIQLAEYAQASYLWICIQIDTDHWLMMERKSDSSFQQELMNEKEAQVFYQEQHCAGFNQENGYVLSKEEDLSRITLPIKKENNIIGCMSLARKTSIDMAFVAILSEITHLIGDYQEYYENREKERKHFSQYATIFQSLPVGLAVFDSAGNFKIGNPQFQHLFPQNVDFKEINLWDLQFLDDDQLSLIKMGLMVQTNSDSLLSKMKQKFGLEAFTEEIHRLYVLSIQENEHKNFSDHYLLMIQPSLSTSMEQKKFQENWEQTSKDLHQQLQVIREVLSLLTKTSVNRNEAEMAKQMNRTLLRFMRTFRIFIDSTRPKITPY